jgi:predicted O-linked N-acetylglucosamine transferase (SPINDLY family)
VQVFVSDRVASPPEFVRFYSEKLILTPDSFFINEYTQRCLPSLLRLPLPFSLHTYRSSRPCASVYAHA